MNIGERFLDDAENCSLHLGRKAAEILGEVEIDFDAAALRETIDVPANGGTQAGLVQQRRVQ